MNTTYDNYKKLLIHFALPMILSLITQQLYSAVDMVIVGQYLGIDELAAVGNTTTVIMILVSLSGGLELGSEVIFAKYRGIENYHAIKSGVRSIFIFSFVGAALLTIFGQALTMPIVIALNIPDNLINLTIDYYQVYIFGLIGLFLYDLSRAILISLGKPGIATGLVLLSSALNIIFDLIFIRIFKLGVTGAALATILAQYLGMICSLILLRHIMKSIAIPSLPLLHKVNWTQIKEILSIALPNVLQQLVLSLSAILLIGLVNPFGSAIISGYLSANKLMLFGILPVIGMSQALSIFTASNYGTDNFNLIKTGHQFILRVTTTITIVVICCNFFIPKYLIGAFIDVHQSPEAYNFARIFLQYSTIAYLFTSWKIVNENLLRGCMKMKPYLISNLTDIIVKMTTTYLFINTFSEHSFWSGNTLAKIASFTVSLLFIRYYFYKPDALTT